MKKISTMAAVGVVLALVPAPALGLDWGISSPDPMTYSGMCSSLQLDSQGYPHVSYYTAFNYDDYRVRYTRWDGSSWGTETVGSSGESAGFGTSLALDSDGRPHISYNSKFDNHGLEYVHWDGLAWQTVTVDGGYGLNVGRYSSLALDSAGRPRISYFDNTPMIVKDKYAEWNGTSWMIEVSGQDGLPEFPSGCLLVDNADRSHIAGGVSGALSYAVRTSSGWEVQQGIGPTSFASIVLDSEQRPHITYVTGDNKLYYMQWDGTQWQSEIVDENTHWGGGAPLVLDASGKPRIAYLIHDEAHTGGAYVRFAAWDGSEWQIEQIGYDHARSTSVCLEMDHLGQYHVIYNGDNMGLRYAVAVPEPVTLSLLALGGLALLRRRERGCRV